MKLLIRPALSLLIIVVLASCAAGEEIPAEQPAADEASSAASLDAESQMDDGQAAASQEADSGADLGDNAEQEAESGTSEEATEEGDGDDDHDDDAEKHEDDDVEDTSDSEVEENDDDGVDDSSDSKGESAAQLGGDGWGESGTTTQTACDNPYLPIRLGSRWTYEADEGPYDWEVTELEGDLEQATAVMEVTIEDLILTYTWNCVAGEGISSFDFAGQGLSSAFPDMKLEVVGGEGAFLTPVDQIEAGHTWQSEIEQTMSFSVGEGVEKIEATADLSTIQSNTILSTDPATAAGVTVDAIQVEQITDITMIMHMMGTDVNQEMTLSSLIDMGRGVGIMNQTVESEFGPSSVTLLSYYIP